MTDSGLTRIPASALMISTMLGSGVVFLPLAFRILGYVNGIIVFVTIASFSLLTLYAISYAAHQYLEFHNKNEAIVQRKGGVEDSFVLSYYSVAKHFNGTISILVDVCLLAQGLGSCVSYILAIKSWCQNLFGFGKSALGSFIFILPLWGLSMMKNLSSLKYTSYLSVFSVIYLMSLLASYTVYFKFINQESLTSLRSMQKADPDTNLRYDVAIGTIIFALGCHQNIVQVFSELKKKTVKEISYVSLLSILGGSFIYLVIGLSGFFIGGVEISDAILEIFIKEDKAMHLFVMSQTNKVVQILTKAGACLFLIVLLSAFPLQMHPARNSAVNIIASIRKNTIMDQNQTQIYKYIVTTIFCSLICGLSMINDLNPTSVVSFIGATATNSITYIFPPILFSLAIGKKNIKSVIGIMMSIVGLGMMIYMLYNSFKGK